MVCLNTTISCTASTAVDASRASKTNLYKVLRLESEGVDFREIRKAYRSMALRYHPDVCHPSKKDEFTRKFVELHRAYETLSDPSSRREYDLELRKREVGLADRGADGFSVRSEFSREVWEVQLAELTRRSERRERAKRRGFAGNDSRMDYQLF